MAARGKTGSPGRASRGEVSYRGLQPASTTLKIYGVFRKLRSEGRRTLNGRRWRRVAPWRECRGEKILSRIGDKMKIGERNTTKVKIAGQNNFRVVLMASKGLKKYDWPIFGQFFPLEFVFNDNKDGWMIGARSFLNEALNIRNTCWKS